MISSDDGINMFVSVEGSTHIAYLKKVPSLADIIKENHGWGNVFEAAAVVGEEEEDLMVENALEHFHSVAADTIRKLDIAGYNTAMMCDETNLRGGYVDDTLNALFLVESNMKKESQNET